VYASSLTLLWWWWSTITARGEEFVDLGIGLGNPRCSRWSPNLSFFLDVGAWWCCLHQSHLFLLRQILQLYRQQSKLSDSHETVFLAPVQYMLLSQFVRESANVVATRYLITLLDVVEGEQSVVAVAHVIHAEMYAGAVGGSA
jgi:hypothetical protein